MARTTTQTSAPKRATYLKNYFLRGNKPINYLACLLMLLFVSMSWGQVANYSFTSSSGTYTPITGGTLLASSTTSTANGNDDG